MARLHFAKSKISSLDEFLFLFICEMPCGTQTHEAYPRKADYADTGLGIIFSHNHDFLLFNT